ncbi:MAG: PAS domain-containing sensor histidine kinase [Deltaproteobacteria bacterium]|nr:PAS domain-containing sensor histidine kinase [Deltaproteobacteria bacterium]
MYEIEDPADPGSMVTIYQNDAARASGARPEHLGLSLRETSPDYADSPHAAMYVDALVSGAPRQATFHWPSEDAPDARIWNVMAAPLDDRRVAVMFKDVTVEHALRRQLAAQMEELRRSNEDLDSFAYVASHDLRAPLRDIKNLATWVMEDTRDVLPEESAGHLTRLVDRVVRMDRMLEDLLAYSRVARLGAGSATAPLGFVVAEALALVPVPPGFTLSVAPLPAIEVLDQPLQLVLRNLVGNAIKHHDRADGRVALDATLDDGWLVLRVADDGPGIPPDFTERAFGVFQTLRPRDHVEGSGMGLAIVKRAVEWHGGRVELAPSPDRGLTVVVRWRLAATGGPA